MEASRSHRLRAFPLAETSHSSIACMYVYSALDSFVLGTFFHLDRICASIFMYGFHPCHSGSNEQICMRE